jgi:hypothetical protein
MNMTTQQKKALWICLAIFVGSYVFRFVFMSSLQIIYHVQQAMSPKPPRRAQPNKPQHAVKSPAPAPKQAPQQRTGPPTQSAAVKPPKAEVPFTGKWFGRTNARQGVCVVSMEIRFRSEGSGFYGFPSMTCRPLVGATAAQAMTLRNSNPASAVLSGEWDKGVITFHVDEVTGENAFRCNMAGDITVRSFGTNQLALDYTDTCGEHTQMLLGRRPS